MSQLYNGEIRIKNMVISMLLEHSAQMNASREKIAQCSLSEKVLPNFTPVHVLFTKNLRERLQETGIRAGHATFQSDISHLTLKIK